MLTDLQMPGGEGVELMRQIRIRHAGRPWLQLIVVTGNATLESAIDSLRLEAAEYLRKPVSVADLVQVVTRAALRADTLRLMNGGGASGQMLGERQGEAEPAGKDDAEQLLRLIWQIQAARREAFPDERLPEASWEMLSELMSLEFAGRRITVGGLCLAASCPVTTALRRIDELVTLGLIAKEQDPADARRQHVRLTDGGRARMEQFLARVSNGLAPA